ncbi:MAG TPA: hypothetical protein VFF06_18345 [Polyangia bacterium]|nr:hypothetical protein [Polyangia bacterium]
MRNLIASILLAAAGCAQTAPSVDVKGSDVDVGLLAGKWEGTYQGKESGRSGTILFDLYAGNRIAEGKVMMNGAQPLAIKFVEVAGKNLDGTLEPYLDPSCNCNVETRFTGRRRGQVLEGTFTTTPVGTTQQQGGTWTVTRKP